MFTLSERESAIFGSVQDESTELIAACLDIAEGDFKPVSIPEKLSITSVISDRQLKMIDENRASFSPALPPLVADVIRITGIRTVQIIDAVNGLLYPSDNFHADFFTWQQHKGLVHLRSNRRCQAKYVVEPRLTRALKAK